MSSIDGLVSTRTLILMIKLVIIAKKFNNLITSSIAKVVTILPMSKPFMKWGLDFIGPIKLQDDTQVTRTY